MDSKSEILSILEREGRPLSAGEVATLGGLDRKEVDKIFAELKKEEAIVSPIRCKWEINK